MSTHAASNTEDLFESSLFDNENYELKTFSFGNHTVRLLCSDSATRLLAAQSCPVVLTDHNDVVLRVLSRNAELNQAEHDIRCLKLEWSSQSDMTNVLAASPDKQGYDLILGADVCYSLNALPALFGVAARLLHGRPGCSFLLGYVSRAHSIDRQLIVDAEAAGFAIKEEMGTRRQVGGSLEGVIYSLTMAAT